MQRQDNGPREVMVQREITRLSQPQASSLEQHAAMETPSLDKTLERAMQFHVVAHVATLMALHDNDKRLRAAAIKMRKRANMMAEHGLRAAAPLSAER
ncbi:hypothetical protein [Desertibaculum subflavum]|uniref:hypothetical protein n=1 Tax=Desertibaculum subflavum TaxID=2268458 RepID=UPI000E66626D